MSLSGNRQHPSHRPQPLRQMYIGLWSAWADIRPHYSMQGSWTRDSVRTSRLMTISRSAAELRASNSARLASSEPQPYRTARNFKPEDLHNPNAISQREFKFSRMRIAAAKFLEILTEFFKGGSGSTSGLTHRCQNICMHEAPII